MHFLSANKRTFTIDSTQTHVTSALATVRLEAECTGYPMLKPFQINSTLLREKTFQMY